MEKRFLMRTLVVLLTVFSLTHTSLGRDEKRKGIDLPNPIVRCAKTTEAPVIDGKLDDPVWQSATKLSDFILYNGEKLATEQTIAHVLYEPKKLYLGFHCNESQMDKIKANVTKRDGPVWTDDCIEIFLNPHGSKDEYFHLIVNSIGTQYDEKGYSDPKSWDGKWEANTSRGENYWEVEMVIPFLDILTPIVTTSGWEGIETGADLRANFNRGNPRLREYSGWSLTFGGFHDPDHFGTLLLSPPEIEVGLVFLGDDYGDLGGESNLRISLRNTTSETQKVRCSSVLYSPPSPGKVVKRDSQKKEMKLKPNEKKTVALKYRIKDVGKYQIAFAVSKKGDKEQLFRSPAYPLKQTQFLPTLRTIGSKIKKARSTLQSLHAKLPKARELKEWLKQADKRRKLLTDYVRAKQPPSLNETRWETLNREINELSSKVHEAMTQVLVMTTYTKEQLKGEVEGPQFVTFVTPAITNDKLLPDSIPDKKYVSREIHLSASPGEYEPATFSLYALKNLEQVKVAAGELNSADAAIPPSNIAIRVVKCWYQAGVGIGDLTHKLLTPELMLNDDDLVRVDMAKRTNALRSPTPRDADELQPVNIPENTLKQFWVTLHVPEDATPGDYQGTVAITPADNTPAEIRLRVTVLPIKLAPPILDYAIYYRGKLRLEGEAQVNSEWKTPEQFEAEMRDMKAHGVDNPTIYQPLPPIPEGGYDFTLLEKVMEIRKKAGMTNVPLLFLGVSTGAPTDSQGLEGLRNCVEEIVKFAKEKGVPDVYIYGVDEATGERLKAQRQAWQTVHEAGGKVFVACYKGYFDLTGDLLDLPVMSGPKAWHAEQVHELGRKMYNYGHPQVGNEEPLTYRRNFGLYLWKNNFDGACDYAYQHSFHNIWDDFDDPSYRDHVFAYPTVNGIIPTIQWEGFREGVDDVRYLSTLLDLVEKAKEQGGGGNEVKKTEKWLEKLDVQDDLDELRRGMVKRIIKLQSLLGK